MAQDLYALDSAEFLTAGVLLGIPHAPAYPLYTLVLHAVTRLPFAPTLLGNALSAFCLAGGAFLFLRALRAWGVGVFVANLVTAVCFFSYHVWVVGLFVEVYAPQVLGVCLVLWALATCKPAHWVGVCVGIAVALHPSSVLMVGGVAGALIARRESVRACMNAGIISVAVFAFPLLYLVVRWQDAPYSMIGAYDMAGVFVPTNLSTQDGLWGVLSGRMFRSLFFQDGFLPTLAQWGQTFVLFFQNFWGVGVLVGLFALPLLRVHRAWGLAWVCAFVPFVWFYTAYGASDKQLMFAPALVLWGVPLAWGMQRMPYDWERETWARVGVVTVLGIIMLQNSNLLNLSQDRSTRDIATTLLLSAPADAVVVARWFEVAPMEYLHYVEGVRPDLALYNPFLFGSATLDTFLRAVLDEGRTVWAIERDVNPLRGFYDVQSFQVRVGDATIAVHELRRKP